jgi:CheY-like chemotaxis protein
MSMAFLLRSWGHVPVVANTGTDAIQAAGDSAPDVVLLDIGMPDVSGWEVASRLRELPSMTEALLVAMSGYGQETDRIHSEAAGCQIHLVKPVSPEALHDLLSAHQRALGPSGNKERPALAVPGNGGTGFQSIQPFMEGWNPLEQTRPREQSFPPRN